MCIRPSLWPLVRWPFGPMVHWCLGPMVHWCIGPFVKWHMRNVRRSSSSSLALQRGYLHIDVAVEHWFPNLATLYYFVNLKIQTMNKHPESGEKTIATHTMVKSIFNKNITYNIGFRHFLNNLGFGTVFVGNMNYMNWDAALLGAVPFEWLLRHSRLLGTTASGDRWTKEPKYQSAPTMEKKRPTFKYTK